MITPGLEKLILCGRAFPKTFVAGGSQKSNIFVENDRFIIITDIVYFSRTNLEGKNSYIKSIDNNDPLQLNTLTTQLTILSERGFNRFLFRDNLISHPDSDFLNRNGVVSPIGNTKIDTYLIHTKAVSFTFSKGGFLTIPGINLAGILDPNTIGSLQTPSDYGKLGTPGAIPVTIASTVSGSAPYSNNYSAGRFGSPIAESAELAFPVDTLTNMVENTDFNCMPIANIFYVEVLGMPGNINI